MLQPADVDSFRDKVPQLGDPLVHDQGAVCKPIEHTGKLGKDLDPR